MFAFLKRTFVVLLGPPAHRRVHLVRGAVLRVRGIPAARIGDRPPDRDRRRRWPVAARAARSSGCASYRASDRLLAAVVAQPQPRRSARTPAEVVKLRERFEEAVGALKPAADAAHSLYDLPWYVIIGAPGFGQDHGAPQLRA